MIQNFAGAICTAQDPCNFGGVITFVVVTIFLSYVILVAGTLFGFYKFRKRKNHSKVAVFFMYVWLAVVAVPAVLAIGSALID